MSRCKATTRKGTQCLNMAMEGSDFCNVHADRDASEGGSEEHREDHDLAYELGETARTLLGVAAVGGVILLALKLGRRW